MRISEPDRALEALNRFWAAAGIEIEPAGASASALPAPAPLRPAAPPAQRPPPPRPALAAPAGRGDTPVAAARALAAGAATLEELAAAIAAFEGCGLKATARQAVVSDGRPGAPVMIVGEAPGKDEDEQGRPFVGRSGQLLDRMLAAIGLSRTENVFITNTVFWRPPGNRRPTPGETALCLPFVERAIVLNAPKVLVLAGAVAVETLLKPGGGVMRMRGKRLAWQGPEGPVNAMVMLHPAYLLRRPQEKALAWADLLALEAWCRTLGVALKPAP